MVVEVQDAVQLEKQASAGPTAGADDIDFKEVSIPEALDILKVCRVWGGV